MKIKDQFSFQDVEIPKDLEHDSLDFGNGRTVDKGKTFGVDNLNIGNVGISAKVWSTDSSTATNVVDKVVAMIDSLGSRITLEKQRKEVNYTTEMKVHLDIDPRRAFSEKFTKYVDSLVKSMAVSDLSKVEVHFPMMSVFFRSDPDVPKLIDKYRNSKDLSTELEAASGLGRLVVIVESINAYRDRVFDVTVSSSCDKAREMLVGLEEALK